MKICKYCNKPIIDNDVWNTDKDGNGYHHSCLCEMEFKSRDKRIYNKGRTDALEQIKEDIKDCLWKLSEGNTYLDITREEVENAILEIIDKYTKGERANDYDYDY